MEPDFSFLGDDPSLVDQTGPDDLVPPAPPVPTGVPALDAINAQTHTATMGVYETLAGIGAEPADPLGPHRDFLTGLNARLGDAMDHYDAGVEIAEDAPKAAPGETSAATGPILADINTTDVYTDYAKWTYGSGGF